MKDFKFGRERDQRGALIKSLADSLVLGESIETTWPKAKAVARYTERLMTHAKKSKDSLHSRRMVISGLMSLEAAHKLVDEIAPKLTGRSSGYFRIERTDLRAGDGAQLAKVSFVDDLKTAKKSPKTAGSKAEDKVDEATKKLETKQTKPTAAKEGASKITPQKTQASPPKRTGIRGNR